VLAWEIFFNKYLNAYLISKWYLCDYCYINKSAWSFVNLFVIKWFVALECTMQGTRHLQHAVHQRWPELWDMGLRRNSLKSAEWLDRESLHKTHLNHGARSAAQVSMRSVGARGERCSIFSSMIIQSYNQLFWVLRSFFGVPLTTWSSILNKVLCIWWLLLALDLMYPDI